MLQFLLPDDMILFNAIDAHFVYFDWDDRLIVAADAVGDQAADVVDIADNFGTHDVIVACIFVGLSHLHQPCPHHFTFKQLTWAAAMFVQTQADIPQCPNNT